MVLFGKCAYCGRVGIVLMYCTQGIRHIGRGCLHWVMTVRGGLFVCFSACLLARFCLSADMSVLAMRYLASCTWTELAWLGLMDLCINLIDLGLT